MNDKFLEEARDLEALSHIKRNGSLLWMDCPAMDAQRIYDRLLKAGKIMRNTWSGEWQLTDSGDSR